MGYDETITYLYGLQSHGIKLGLDNPRELLRRAGNPEQAFRSVHIAGTNGKGSTAAMLQSMLGAAGFKAGLFTSPHLVSFTERIRIGDMQISRDEVIALAQEVRESAGGMDPTFFEVVTVMGFHYFKRHGADWAVVETGMGGRLDATNTLTPAVTVITPIGQDHREFLGDSIEEIAGEKAGIIKPGIPVVCASQEPGAMDVIRRTCMERGAPLHVFGDGFSSTISDKVRESVVIDYKSEGLSITGLTVPLAGDYQAANAALAIRAFELACPDHPDKEETIRSGLGSLSWPGRMELVAEKPATYLDGAHNPRAAESLAALLTEDYLQDGRPLTLVMGVMGDKDIEGIVRPLIGLATHVIFAAPAYGRSAPTKRLMEIARSMGIESEAAPSVAEALTRARARGDMVLVTGSFYTIGEAKEALGSKGFLTNLREWQAAP